MSISELLPLSSCFLCSLCVSQSHLGRQHGELEEVDCLSWFAAFELENRPKVLGRRTTNVLFEARSAQRLKEGHLGEKGLCLKGWKSELQTGPGGSPSHLSVICLLLRQACQGKHSYRVSILSKGMVKGGSRSHTLLRWRSAALCSLFLLQSRINHWPTQAGRRAIQHG